MRYQGALASATDFLGDAGSSATSDLSDLFAPGAIPQGVPEPETLSVLGSTLAGLLTARRCTQP